MYDKNFEKIVQLVFGSEGGFSNHPNDRGGRTNYGVTQATYYARLPQRQRLYNRVYLKYAARRRNYPEYYRG